MSTSVFSRVMAGRGVRSGVGALVVAATIGGAAMASVTSASALDEYTPTLLDTGQVEMIMQKMAPVDEKKTLAGLPEFQPTTSGHIPLLHETAAEMVRAGLPKLRPSQGGNIYPVGNSQGATVKMGVSAERGGLSYHIGTKDVSIAEYCTTRKDFCGFVGVADSEDLWPRVAGTGNMTGQGGSSATLQISNAYTKSTSTTTTNGWSLATTFGGSGGSGVTGGIEYSQSVTEEKSFTNEVDTPYSYTIPNGQVGRVEARFNGAYYNGWVAVRESDGDGVDGNGDIKLFPARHVLAPSSKAATGVTVSAVKADNPAQINAPENNTSTFLKMIGERITQNATFINGFLEAMKVPAERPCYAFVGCVK